jgi:Arc/MetJ-type ribon-helix-helix transcriptional regulator
MSEMQRFTVEFSPETVAIIEGLKKKLGKRSNADVIRLSLQVLSYLEKQRDQGYSVGIILRKEGDPSGMTVKEVELIS